MILGAINININTFAPILLGIGIIVVYLLISGTIYYIYKRYLKDKLKDKESVKKSGFYFFLGVYFLLIFLDQFGDSVYSYISCAFGLIFILSGIFSLKKDSSEKIYFISVGLILAGMLVALYLNAPSTNTTIFYIDTAILAVATFLLSPDLLSPEKGIANEKKIFKRINLIIFFISFLVLFGVFIYHGNMEYLLIISGIIALIILGALFIRKKFRKNNEIV